MTIIAILGAFAGILLGLRLKVFAVVPFTMMAGAATFLTLAIWGESTLTAAMTCAVGIIAIQIGYLSASFATAQQDAPSPEQVAVARAVNPSQPQPVSLSDR